MVRSALLSAKARVRSADGGMSQACREPRNPEPGPALKGFRGFRSLGFLGFRGFRDFRGFRGLGVLGFRGFRV